MQKHDPMLIDIQSADLSTLGSLCTASQVRSIDHSIIEQHGIAGLDLMRLAAEASCHAIEENWPNVANVRVYCGSGNNAADGYIVAGLLAQRQIGVEVVEVGSKDKLSKDGHSAYRFCAGSESVMRVSADRHKTSAMPAPDLIVDALLGTGFRGDLRNEYAEVIGEINAFDCPVLALDLPSGLSADTGSVLQAAVAADVTVTFIALKRGLLTGKGKDCSGKLYLAPLVERCKTQEIEGTVDLLNLDSLRHRFPKRKKDAHKYDFGHVLVVGGDMGMGGAVMMTGLAAMRCGAGLVTIATHPDHALQIGAQYPELMVRGVNAETFLPLLETASVLALGPGLGQSDWSRALFDTAIESKLPIVVDADGLNHLAQRPQRRDNWVLTPHPGEASRLLGSSSVQQDRFASAKELQVRYGGVAVLKGAGTILAKEIASEERLLSLCPYGNSGMSTAGMGDVLCGVIAGLLAQSGDSSLAAELGVALHSAAADECVAQQGIRGLMATDLIPMVRRLLNDV